MGESLSKATAATLIAACKGLILRAACVNDCLSVAQTVALECDLPLPPLFYVTEGSLF